MWEELPLECPICKEYNEQDNFACPSCNRADICGSHYNFDHLVCSECAEKVAPPKPKKKSGAAPVSSGPVLPVNEDGESIDPFYRHSEKCPVCKNSFTQRWFKAKTYSERNVDVDKHPQGYMWTEKGCEVFNPPLYYIWHCDNCHYSDAHMTYSNPMKDPYSNFRDLKDIYIEKYHDDARIEKIIDKLGENIDYDKINYYHAIKLHLLAIFIQELIEEVDERDSLKTARYYLRLGWLFRELYEKPDKNVKIIKTLDKLSAFIKKGWSEAAFTEEAALKKSVEYFELAFKSSNSIKSISAEVDILLWVAGILLKLEDNPNALKYFNMVLSRGQKSKQKIEGRLKEVEKGTRQMAPEDVRSWDKQLRVIDSLMGKARDLMSDIKAKKMKEEKAKASVILKKAGDRPPEELRAILIKKGIDKGLAAKLTPLPEKKKFLGLF